MVNRIILNETSYFGPGSRKVIAEEVAKRGYKKALVITDKDLVKFGVAAQVTDVLKAAGIPYEVFDNVKQNPTVRNVKAGTDAFQGCRGGLYRCDRRRFVYRYVESGGYYRQQSGVFGCGFARRAWLRPRKISVPVIALPTTAWYGCRGNDQLRDYRRGECEEDGLRRSERSPRRWP